jgi:hypothetical protein
VIFIGGVSAEENIQYHEKLKNAILCGVNGIHSVREIAALGNRQFTNGYAGFSFGDEMMQKDVVILEESLEMYDARSNAVIVEVDSTHFNFSGIVYSRFNGNYEPVIKGLGLLDTAEKNPAVSGRFQKSTGLDISGKTYDTCPMTIILQPLEKDKFLLGCGWCNG